MTLIVFIVIHNFVKIAFAHMSWVFEAVALIWDLQDKMLKVG